MTHKFDKCGYYLLQEYGGGDKFISFAICNECWNNKVKTDKFLYQFRFLTNRMNETKKPWKPELIPVDCECEFDKFKETVCKNL